MQSQTPDRDLRRFVRRELARRPLASFDNVLAAWQATGVRMDAAAEARLAAIYEREAPGYQLSRREGFWSGWTARVGNTLIGLPVLCVVFSVLLGDVELALGLLALVVICTAGISLVVLLPLAWVVGLTVVEVTRAILRLRSPARA